MLPPRPTEWLQDGRLVVVSIDPENRYLRVRGAHDACSDLRCGQDTVVAADQDASLPLEALSPGDIVKLESSSGAGPTRIVLLRRAWEEYASPEL